MVGRSRLAGPTLSYAVMYWVSLVIPVISVLGVTLGHVNQGGAVALRRQRFFRGGHPQDAAR